MRAPLVLSAALGALQQFEVTRRAFAKIGSDFRANAEAIFIGSALHPRRRKSMTSKFNISLSGPDLAALLCSRVCHDVISPVGAINNGLELLDEGGTDADALDLIRTSALNASVRLKFARLAFGASGSAGASIDTGEAEKAAKDFAAAEKKVEVTWSGPRAIVAKNRVKLLLNLFLVAYGAIPRGGNADIVLENPEGDARFEITVKGRMMRVPAKFAALAEGTEEEAIDAHSVQPYYTLLLAEEAGMKIEYKIHEDRVVFTASMAGAAEAA